MSSLKTLFLITFSSVFVLSACGKEPVSQPETKEKPSSTNTSSAEIEKKYGKKPIYVPELANLPTAITSVARPGDVIVAQGAGDIVGQIKPLCKVLEQHHD